MSIGSKILWSEGLTLGPQHFQLQDIYHENRLRRIVATINPHLWGVLSMQWNLDALGHNRLHADTLSVLFPDGDVYDAPGADLLPEPVDLSRLPADIQTFTFYLALPVLKPQGGNAEGDSRYARCAAEALDLFTEALAIDVPYLKKQPRLISHLVTRDAYASVPLIRISRTEQGGFEMDASFIAPCVGIGATPALGRMLDGLISAMSAKIEALQRMHRKVSADTYELSSGEMSSSRNAVSEIAQRGRRLDDLLRPLQNGRSAGLPARIVRGGVRQHGHTAARPGRHSDFSALFFDTAGGGPEPHFPPPCGARPGQNGVGSGPKLALQQHLPLSGGEAPPEHAERRPHDKQVGEDGVHEREGGHQIRTEQKHRTGERAVSRRDRFSLPALCPSASLSPLTPATSAVVLRRTPSSASSAGPPSC